MGLRQHAYTYLEVTGTLKGRHGIGVAWDMHVAWQEGLAEGARCSWDARAVHGAHVGHALCTPGHAHAHPGSMVLYWPFPMGPRAFYGWPSLAFFSISWWSMLSWHRCWGMRFHDLQLVLPWIILSLLHPMSLCPVDHLLMLSGVTLACSMTAQSNISITRTSTQMGTSPPQNTHLHFPRRPHSPCKPHKPV